MNKAENTYWVNSRPTLAKRGGRGKARAAVRSTTRRQWWSFAVGGFLTLMLCLTVNFRAFTTLSKEWAENAELENKIKAVESENLNIQEEIHYLKYDPATVEREARKFGLTRPREKAADKAK